MKEIIEQIRISRLPIEELRLIQFLDSLLLMKQIKKKSYFYGNGKSIQVEINRKTHRIYTNQLFPFNDGWLIQDVYFNHIVSRFKDEHRLLGYKVDFHSQSKNYNLFK